MSTHSIPADPAIEENDSPNAARHLDAARRDLRVVTDSEREESEPDDEHQLGLPDWLLTGGKGSVPSAPKPHARESIDAFAEDWDLNVEQSLDTFEGLKQLIEQFAEADIPHKNVDEAVGVESAVGVFVPTRLIAGAVFGSVFLTSGFSLGFAGALTGFEAFALVIAGVGLFVSSVGFLWELQR